MNRGIFLLLGTNQGDRLDNLTRARHSLEQILGKIKNSSGIYKTAAWGMTNQPDFYNQVIEIDTRHTPRQVLDHMLLIEQDLGRVRTEKWGPRIIDIDLLFYKDSIISEPGLIVPHPGIVHRKFTLVPLVEIAPDLVHPVAKKNMQDLLIACGDSLPVENLGLRG